MKNDSQDLADHLDTEETQADYIVFVSWGNDSISLVQWLHEQGTKNVVCVFSDTGWADPAWADRVAAGEEMASNYGFDTVRLISMGMEKLVQIKKSWPSNQFQFCTKALKIEPARLWMDENDPAADAICVIGVRREESKRRASYPEVTVESDAHGGRELWAPLVRVLTPERDELIARAGFEVLPHRSMECFPCVNANRRDLQMLTPERVDEIAALEDAMGTTSKGKPRTMFRPKRFAGHPVGIRDVVKWAKSGPKWRTAETEAETEETTGCGSGWCG